MIGVRFFWGGGMMVFLSLTALRLGQALAVAFRSAKVRRAARCRELHRPQALSYWSSRAVRGVVIRTGKPSSIKSLPLAETGAKV